MQFSISLNIHLIDIDAIPGSQVEYCEKKRGLLEKITIKQMNSLSCTEFSEEYEMGPCQVLSLGQKNVWH